MIYDNSKVPAWAGISIYEDRLYYDEEPYVLTLDDLLADDWEVIE